MAESFKKVIGVQDLLDAGLHFGHQTKRWNPKMKRYIHGAKNGIYIIDLNKTLSNLEVAKSFLNEIVLRGEKVLFVGTKKQAREIIQTTATELNQPYVIHRWLGGMLTNNKTIRSSVSRMQELQKMEADGTMDKLLKKEVSVLRRELYKLERNLTGIAAMEKKPGALFIIDLNREKLAVAEAQKLNIPIIAIVDTNTDPDLADYPIPGNDDSLRSIGLISEVLGETISEARKIYEAKAKAEREKREKIEAEEREKARIAREERKKKELEEKKKREEVLKKIKEQKKKEDAKKKSAEAKKKKEEPATEKKVEKTEPKEEKKATEEKVAEPAKEKAPKEEKPSDKKEAKKEEAPAKEKKETEEKPKAKEAAPEKKVAPKKKAAPKKEETATTEEKPKKKVEKKEEKAPAKKATPKKTTKKETED